MLQVHPYHSLMFVPPKPSGPPLAVNLCAICNAAERKERNQNPKLKCIYRREDTGSRFPHPASLWPKLSPQACIKEHLCPDKGLVLWSRDRLWLALWDYG